jgi:hypothetical protein
MDTDEELREQLHQAIQENRFSVNHKQVITARRIVNSTVGPFTIVEIEILNSAV